MKSLSAKTFQCGVTVQGLTTLSGTVYLTALTNTATWDYVIVGTSAQGQLYTRTYAQLMSDVSSGITLSLDGLSDVVAPTPSTGQLLRYNGIQWANWTPTFYSLPAGGTTLQYIDGTGAFQTFPTSLPASSVKHQVKAGVAINKGQAVYVTSADGTNMIVGLASNASEATSSKTMGLLDATVSTNGFANVVTEGLLAGLDTSAAGAEGDPVWLGTGGNLIYGLANKPYAPAHLVFIGIVTRKNNSNGEIFVKVQNGFELNEIHDVDIKTTVPVNGHILGFDGTLWVNKTIAGWLGYTPANASGTTNYISKFTGSTTLGNSQIFDNGTNVGIGLTTPQKKLDVSGTGIVASFGGTFSPGQFAGLHFGYSESNSNNDSYKKSALVFERTDNHAQGGNASGKIHFLLNNIASGSATSLSHSVMVIDTDAVGTLGSARVGIGTANPSYPLHVIGDVALQGNDILLGASGQITYARFVNAGANYLYAESGGTLSFGSNGATNHIFIGISGNVGIGTTSPTSKLDVVGTVTATAIQLNTGSGDYYVNGSGNTLRIGSLTTANKIQLELFHSVNPVSLGIAYDGGRALPYIESVHPSYDVNTHLLFKPGGGETWRIGSHGSTHIYGHAFAIKPAANDYDFYLANSSGTALFYSDTSLGNIGIGTTSPNEKLHVSGNSVGITIDGTIASRTYYNRAGAYIWSTGLRAGDTKFHIYDERSADRFVIDDSGNVGIGTISPGYKLDVNGTFRTNDRAYIGEDVTFTSPEYYYLLSASSDGLLTFTNNTVTQGQAQGFLSGELYLAGSAAFLNHRGINIITTNRNTSTGNIVRAFYASGRTGNTGAANTIAGFLGGVNIEGSGNVTNAIGLEVELLSQTNNKTITNMYGVKVQPLINSVGTITNTYGLYIDSLTAGTQTNPAYGIYQAGTDKNYFGGNVGIGTTVPAQQLHVTQNIALGLTGGSIGDTNNILFPTVNGTHTYAPNGIFYTKKGNWGGQIDIRTSYDWGYATDNAKISLNGAEGNGIVFYTGASALGASERVRITATGNVAINTTDSSLAKVRIVGEGGSGNAALMSDYGNTAVLGEVSTIAHRGGQWHTLYVSESGGSATNAVYVTGTKPVILNAGNVGIGTGSPIRKLHVNGDVQVDTNLVVSSGIYNTNYYAGSATATYFKNSVGTDTLTILQSGNVGIGTTTPGFKLDVNGAARVNQGGVNGSGQALIVAGSGDVQLTDGGSLFFGAYDYGGSTYIRAYDDSNIMYFYLNGTNMAYFRNDRAYFNANVGIGTSSPTQILHVAGNIRVTGAFYDSNNQAGSAGQILKSTGTGTDWVSLSEITGVDGSGTANYVTKWSDADTVTNSLIYDNGTNVGIGTTSPGYNFDVNGQVRVQDKLRVGTVNSGNGVVHMSSSATINPNTTTIVWAQNVSVGMCAFIEYYILNDTSLTDQRAGTIMVTWNQSGTPTIAHTETTTPDIGSTIAVNFTSSLVGADARINAVNSSANPYTIVMSYKYF